MAFILYLPPKPAIECKKGDMTKPLMEYFKVLGTVPKQIAQQAKFIEDEECKKELLDAVFTLQDIIDEITGILFTDVYQKLKDRVHEMELKVREFIRDIDIYLQKLIIQAAAALLKFLGIPTILDQEIPFLCEYEGIAEDGTVTKYKPKFIDIFTKDGKTKIKASARECADQLEEFFGDVKDFFTGELNFKSLDEQAEKLWGRIQIEINKLFNNFIIVLIEKVYNLIKKIPGLGALVKFVDIASNIEEFYKEAKQKVIEEYKSIKEKLMDHELGAKIKEELKKKAKAILDDFINLILDFGLPAPFNITIRDVLGIEDLDTEWKKFKVTIKERVLEKLEETFKRVIESIRKWLAGGWIKTLYDLLLKLVKEILEQFPILKKIIQWIELIIEIITGQYDWCKVMNVIAKPIFGMADKMYAAVEAVKCIKIEYKEFGYLPPTLEEPAAAT